uniref:Uncharacterized protein n=1 Tax=Setaria digitata TaxID=48799 RepID=A0A915PM10_9BILA
MQSRTEAVHDSADGLSGKNKGKRNRWRAADNTPEVLCRPIKNNQFTPPAMPRRII